MKYKFENLIPLAMNYEQEQRQLLDNYLSDDETADSDDSSDNYVPSSDYSDSDNEPPRKKYRKSRNIDMAYLDNQNNVELETISDTIERVVQDYMFDPQDEIEIINDITWGPLTGDNIKKFEFTPLTVGFDIDIAVNYVNRTPIDFFNLFIDDDIINLMVVETNLYAFQNLQNVQRGSQCRLTNWTDTNANEIKKFMGVLLWMGLVKYPSLCNYWSKKKEIYSNEVKNAISRNKFQLLLSMWHFHDNNDLADGSKLRKINPLLQKLKTKYQEIMVPNENLCIDETIVPFRGRLSFRQYIKNKRHKFGIKLFKLCTKGGYTYNFSVYCGKEEENYEPVPTNVVLNLMGNLLDKGYTLYTDNYYTSVSLAHKLLARNTHLVGTLRKNRKLNPKQVVEQKLKPGEIISKESDTGVVVSKWMDKRDVLVLSTKHGNEIISIQSRNKNINKPKVIVDYNISKTFIDVSDQIKAYNTSLRRGMKWYRKLTIELLSGTTVVNAFKVYTEVTKNKISITQFKEDLCEELLNSGSENEFNNTEHDNHILHEVQIRRR